MTFADDVNELKGWISSTQTGYENTEAAISAIYAGIKFAIATAVREATPDDEAVPDFGLLKTDETLSQTVRDIINDEYGIGNKLHPLNSAVSEFDGLPWNVQNDLMNLYTPNAEKDEMLRNIGAGLPGLLNTIEDRQNRTITQRFANDLQKEVTQRTQAVIADNPGHILHFLRLAAHN